MSESGHGKEGWGRSLDKSPEASLLEFELYRPLFRFLGSPGALELLKKDPKEAVTFLLDKLSDTPHTVSAEEAEKFLTEGWLSNGQRSALDQGEPSELEGYFLAKVAERIPEFSDSDDVVNSGSFSVLDSMACLRDEVRTKLFTNAVVDAVNQAVEKREGGEEIVVVDAGSGAIPIMAIVAAFTNDRVRCICIESSENACMMARAIIDSVGLGDRVVVVHADARSFVVDDVKIDVFISETMDSGLLREPMVDIFSCHTHNLRPDGVCVPCAVEVLVVTKTDADIASVSDYVKVDQYVWPVLNGVDWRTVHNWNPLALVPNDKVNFSVSGTDGTEMAVVSTRVHFPNGTSLEPGMSKITAFEFIDLKSKGLNRISYALGDSKDAVNVAAI